MNAHLTHEQISDLLIADPTICDLDLPQTAAAEEIHTHLLNCRECTQELEELRQSLAGFRIAATHFAAAQEPRQRVLAPVKTSSGYPRLAFWSVCAAALVVTISTAFEHRDSHPGVAAAPVARVQAQTIQPKVPHTVESDEALLASIDQDLSADIPASMQPLEDPTASDASTSTSK